MGGYLILGSTILLFVGYIWGLYVALKVDFWWFIGAAFAFPLIFPIFAILNWKKAENPCVCLSFSLFFFIGGLIVNILKHTT